MTSKPIGFYVATCWQFQNPSESGYSSRSDAGSQLLSNRGTPGMQRRLFPNRILLSKLRFIWVKPNVTIPSFSVFATSTC